MVKISPKTSKKGLFAAITGTVLVALCCFTPLLVILMAAIELTALTPYLDYMHVFTVQYHIDPSERDFMLD